MILSTALLGIFAAVAITISEGARTYKVVCYYSSWATYRNGYGKFTADDIDPHICTHVVYAFAGLDADGSARVLDPWLSLETGGGLGDFRKFTDLKRKNPDLKLMLGVGGWNEGSEKFSRMVSVPRSRKAFIDSAVYLIRDNQFDGLNIDWQYPSNRGGLALDKKNFVTLLQELRTEFNTRGYTLGISAAGNLEITNAGYDVPAVTQLVDYVSLLTYDYHGSWETVTGLNSPLYPRKADTSLNRNLNQDATIQLWLKKGADASKLLLGLATYGRTYVLREPRRNRIGDPSFRPGNPGRFTQQDGFLGYNEIIDMFEERDGFQVEFDEESKTPIAWNNDLWISYDNERSFGIKAEYIKKLGLGGAMVWSLDTDDFNGLSGKRNPLLNSLKDVLEDGKTVPTSGPITGAPPTRPPNATTRRPAGLVCTGPGIFQHPDDCTKFYTCIVGVSGHVPVINTCPAGLAFDKSAGACNWMDAVPECHA